MLSTVAAEFQNPHVGVATSPYRAVPGPSFWSRLEAVGMNTDFIAGILVTRMFEGMHFAVGPPLWRGAEYLQAMGGVERLKDHLAEDLVMGKFAAEAGHGAILSSYVIEHQIGSADLRHQRRTVCVGHAVRGVHGRLAIWGSRSLCRCRWRCWSAPLPPPGGRR
jgi:ceramide glucosyltransferase